MEKLVKSIYQDVLSGKNRAYKETDHYEASYRMEDGKMVVFISVSDANSRAFVSRGLAETLDEAVRLAVRRFNRNKPAGFKAESVKLDIVTSVRPVKRKTSRINIDRAEVRYNRGGDGLLFGKSFNTAFLPREVQAYRMVENRKIVRERVYGAFEKHFLSSNKKAVKRMIASDYMDVYKFKTEEHFYSESEGYLRLTRGRRSYGQLTAQDMWDAVALAKDNYYKHAVNSKGKFVYSFLPDLNQKPDDYNILRHAGTTYSMIETYELMPDDGLLKEIQRAIDFLLQQTKKLTINGHEVDVVVEGDLIKLGGNGLSIVALAKYTQVTGDRQYLPIMQSMATWIYELQNGHDRFSVHKQKYSTGKDTDFVSHYYPGEAILAMARLYQVDGNEKWLDAGENEANYLINTRDNDATLKTIAHDHWLLYALNDLYRERPKEMYLKHAFFVSEAIIRAQRLGDDLKPGWYGSYEKPGTPASTPVACRSEGLGAAYRLASDHGYHSEAEKYKSAIEEGIKFQLQMQLKPESVMYFDYKDLCLGAVHRHLNHFELRNDFTQHNISSFISYYRILKNNE
ncbi:beta-L-arabinofuranosidase domain-containing protein [Alteribacter natronophilus]|uniref:beta-L-arabinofuranosidase domain-containing protein n=1 Tax=Alteribacter natronophilus TaxID=2583810 RepID=UPI00110DFB69|nr:beta-L-arabinofuranosidase domain-containing protein [Alteribacter natronophilus]TMW72323.1 hypothetical protein FGB90_08950 [Alteribacter natronophilus]